MKQLLFKKFLIQLLKAVNYLSNFSKGKFLISVLTYLSMTTYTVYIY